MSMEEKDSPAIPQDHGGAIYDETGAPVLCDFSASINPLGQPMGLAEVVVERWGETLHYPDRAARGLVTALTKEFRLPAECLLPANGSTELIAAIYTAMKPKRVVMTAPDFGLYTSLLPEGLEAVTVARDEENGFALDTESFITALGEGDLAIFSNPGNPSGATLGAEGVTALAAAARDKGATLVVDEAFADFCPEISVLARAPELKGVIVLRSMTKFYAIPGIRLGFAAAAPETIGKLAAVLPPWSVSTTAQVVGEHCLADETWGAKTKQYVDKARTKLSEELKNLEGFTPLTSAANYLLVRLDPPAPSAGRLYAQLRECGTVIRHCASFGLGERYIRIAVRTVGENADLVANLRRILSETKQAPEER